MSGSQASIFHANDREIAAGVEPELAQALLLVRVSTMKMLRLQLALERRDRAVALQAVDDLMELDAWMAVSAGGRTADSAILDAIAGEADDERGALLQEKFGLAAGLVKRASEVGPRPWIEQEPAPAIAAGQPDAEDSYDFLGMDFELPEDEAPRRLSWLLVVALLVLVLAAAAGTAFMLGWRPDALLAQLLSHGGY